MKTPNNKGKTNTKLLAAITLIIVIIIAAAAGSYILTSQPPQQNNNKLPAMTLTLVGSDGTTKTLNENDITALQSYTGSGGIRSQGNQISGVGSYTGVPIAALLDSVGGMKKGETLTATASDGYTMTYTYAVVVNGQGFTTYDTSGSQQTATQPLKLVLTYSFEGAPLESDLGPLRIGILGSEGLVTQGNQWAKMVIKLQVDPEEPEVTQTPAPTAKPTVRPTSRPTAAPTTPPTPTPTPPPNLPATQLELVGADGTTLNIDQADLASYTQTSGLGGKFKHGETSYYGTYAGVSIFDLADLVGGMTSSQILCVTGNDGYAKNFTYGQVTGTDLEMYDPDTNTAVTPTNPVTMILAYQYNGESTNLETDSDGTYLMTAFVGQDGYSTTANLYCKFVVKLQICDQ